MHRPDERTTTRQAPRFGRRATISAPRRAVAAGGARSAIRWLAASLVVVTVLGALAACSPTVARVINPRNRRCQESMRKAFAVMLVGEGEPADAAEKLAAGAVQALGETDLGPRPFKLSAPSGVDYGFFFEREDDRCLLRLVAWQKGIVQYSNNVTFIATRPLPGCGCEQ
jgi:hypothetical protein